jgi:hypothetical protein
MMAPAPADRFATYDELLRALELASVARTRPAGVLVRSIATGIDLLVALVLVGVGLTLRWLLTGNGNVQGEAFIFTALGAYAAIAVARWGRTAGQALLELEVVDVATGQRPSFRTSAIRAAASIALPGISAWIGFGVDAAGYQLAGVGAFAGGVLSVANGALLLWALASPAKRTAWDRVSGTLVRYRTVRTATTDGLVR